MGTHRPINLILAGVGGQGSILATRIVAGAARRAGLPVTTSEVHGMSQRGGTVLTTVRIGAGALSPVVPAREADFLVAFELLEAARHLPLLRQGGIAVVNDQRIAPSLEALRHAGYPGDLDGHAEALGIGVHRFPALELANDLGESRLSSTVLLGALSNFMTLPTDAWRGAIAETVPAKTVSANLAAFVSGAEWLVGSARFSF